TVLSGRDIGGDAPGALGGVGRLEGAELHLVGGGEVAHGEAHEGRSFGGDVAGREAVDEDPLVVRGYRDAPVFERDLEPAGHADVDGAVRGRLGAAAG